MKIESASVATTPNHSPTSPRRPITRSTAQSVAPTDAIQAAAVDSSSRWRKAGRASGGSPWHRGKPSEIVYEVHETLLDEIMRKHIAPANKGSPVSGIEGTNVDLQKRSITLIHMKTGQTVSAGDSKFRYSQQSMSKPTAMVLAAMLLLKAGLEKRIGFEASGKKYNELAYISGKRGVPSNASINPGALKVWDSLTAKTPSGTHPVDLYLDLLRKMTGNPNLAINEEMANNEFSFAPADGSDSNNIRLLKLLKSDGALEHHDVNEVYLNYCRACAVMVTTEEMARVSAVLGNHGKDPITRRQVIDVELADMAVRSNAISGSYDESGTEYKKSGFKGKTGVDGGIFGILESHPDFAVACHHQELNGAGNSGESQKWIHEIGAMKLAFPKRGVIGKARSVLPFASKLARLRADSLGPSPREIDDQLKSSLTPGSSALLAQSLRSSGVLEKGQGYYMKSGRKGNMTVAAAQLRGGSPLPELRLMDGSRLFATLKPSTHDLAKVIVTQTSPQEINRIAEEELRTRADGVIRDIGTCYSMRST